MNGTAFKVNSTSKEHMVKSEHVPKVPFNRNLIERNLNSFIEPIKMPKTTTDKFIHYLYINNFNARTNINELEKELSTACLAYSVLSGYIKEDCQLTFTVDEVKKVLDKIVTITDPEKQRIARICNLFDIASNIISMSVINFIRLNHHYDNKPSNINIKMFLPYTEVHLPNFVSNDGELLEAFYECIYPSGKLIHEVLYYHHLIKKALGGDIKYQCINIPYIVRVAIEEPIVLIRSKPTVNTFTTINLMVIMIRYLKDYGIIQFFMSPKHVKLICIINDICIEAPFTIHPSCGYFGLTHPNYSNLIIHRDKMNTLYGGLLRAFVNHMEGSLKDAKSTVKYESSIGAKENSAISILDGLETGGFTITEEKLKILKESVGSVDLNFTSKEEFAKTYEEFSKLSEDNIDIAGNI